MKYDFACIGTFKENTRCSTCPDMQKCSDISFMKRLSDKLDERDVKKKGE